MQTDAVVGRVLEAIDRSGEADRTIVIFSSDNGCAPYAGAAELEKMGHYPSGPLRGYKFDVWEGGTRMPMIVRWPEVVKAGRVSGALVHQADVMATCAEIVGAKLPADAGEDSFSMMGVLEGKSEKVRELAVTQSGAGVLAIRRGDWKLVFGKGPGGSAKDATKDAVPGQLYHLADDLGETNNLYRAQPQIVADLQAAMKALIDNGRSTPGPKQPNDVPVKWKPAGPVTP
jgi:arylsulfatase A-like enzyme